MEERLIRVGSLVNTQGIRGEVRVISHTDFPEKRFARGSRLILVHPQLPRIELEVASARKHKNFYLLRFVGHPSINDVERYKGGELKIRETELESLPEGSNYIFELVGCRVETEDGEELGELVEVLQPGANDVYVVKPPKGKSILLPAIPECIKEVDVANKLVRVHLMEGLMD
ncbi:ribosome maturation factor RimM [Effusibacillus lacus]|uniref:Ribosome maturation factor RimM n=1 Tax=Effusibacillus lacus TaxID=1348429 RepID=A0A292YNB3_9BACL|nr:ribosome maturation factor RimM [Effusibacillus lacus]TCS76595.1 16S rRNA processing protein RimM [Effusibacillus lacus]GAX90389.1 ribosome maturation factor RimM [Effusibacillus lacus]